MLTFFIISGFIMCYSTHEKQISCLRFLKLRIRRIFSLYWLLTTLAFILYLLPFDVFHEKEAISILDSYFLLPMGNKYLVGTGWTLSYEFYFYFIFAGFLLSSFKSYIRYIFIILTILVLTILGWMNVFSSLWMVFICNYWLIEFAFGIIAFILFKYIQLPVLLCCILIFCGSPTLIYQNFDDAFLNSPYRVLYIDLPMLCIFNGFLHIEIYFQRTRNQLFSLFEQIDNSSYSLYLSHPFVLVLSSFICVCLHLTNSIVFIFCLLVSSIIFGVLVYQYIERPLLRWVKKIIALSI